MDLYPTWMRLGAGTASAVAVVGEFEIVFDDPIQGSVGDDELMAVIDEGIEIEVADEEIELDLDDDELTGETC